MDSRQWNLRTFATTTSLLLAIGGANGQAPSYRVVNPSCCPPCQPPTGPQPSVVFPQPQTPSAVPTPSQPEQQQPPSAPQPDATISMESPDLGLGGGLALGEST